MVSHGPSRTNFEWDNHARLLRWIPSTYIPLGSLWQSILPWCHTEDFGRWSHAFDPSLVFVAGPCWVPTKPIPRDMQKQGWCPKYWRLYSGYFKWAWLSLLTWNMYSYCISRFMALFEPNVRNAHWQLDGHFNRSLILLIRPEVRGSPDQGDQEQKTWLWRPAGSTYVFKMMLMSIDY